MWNVIGNCTRKQKNLSDRKRKTRSRYLHLKHIYHFRYEGVSKSFRTVRLERELQMVQLCATRCSCIAILWVSLVSFTAITLCVASQRVFIVVSVYFVIDSVRELLDTPSYIFYIYLLANGDANTGNKIMFHVCTTSSICLFFFFSERLWGPPSHLSRVTEAFSPG